MGVHRSGRAEEKSTVPVAIVGAGRLARALSPLLGPAGFPPVALLARRPAARRALAAVIAPGRVTSRPEIALRGAKLVLLAVPDRQIAPIARELAEVEGIDWADRVVLHHAGALGLEPLEPLAGRGAGTGVLHPLQCLGEPRLAAAVLPGSRARIEGDRRGRPLAARLARALGMIPLRMPRELRPSQREAYHAAASLLSNDVVALLSIGVEMLDAAGVGRRAAEQALVELARGTLLQAGREGLAAALTGPAARGDVETVTAHLEQLRRISGGAEAHRLLSLRLAREVRARGSGSAADRIEAALDGAGKGDPGSAPDDTV